MTPSSHRSYFNDFDKELSVSGHCFHHILAQTKVSSNMFSILKLQNMSIVTPCVLMRECIHGCMCMCARKARNDCFRFLCALHGQDRSGDIPAPVYIYPQNLVI